MSLTIWTYLSYLALSIGFTVWVARALHRMGGVFLVDVFDGREALAQSINGLLVVGFYLINFGFVSLALREGTPPRYMEEAIRLLSQKIGLVLLVLGGMHFFNLLVFSVIRTHRRPKADDVPVRRRRPRPQSDPLAPGAQA